MPAPRNPGSYDQFNVSKLHPSDGFNGATSSKQVRRSVARSAHKPMHPGFRNLTNFTAPPDGDKIPAEEIAAANPSPEVLDAAARLTPAELEYIFIDAVGSIEVTHPEYTPPNEELLQRAGPLVDFFRKLTGADVEEKPMSPELKAFIKRESPDYYKQLFGPKDTIESQAAQLVKSVVQQAREAQNDNCPVCNGMTKAIDKNGKIYKKCTKCGNVLPD